ncbi:Lipase class 3 [Fusarium albosuccineum]|uniref:Lipase class 3 n=1 Tax=Fusarium albosuccineum TaxID=1237068 RepID=A0A8H4P548_9HYPO|nr:Lipase class 3 [Fusarium albosuccineum]
MPINLFKKLKLKPVLETGSKVAENAEASNSVPSSTTGSKNSQASSTAVKQLSQDLKFTLNTLDSQKVGDFRDFKNKRLVQLKKGAENYTNSNVNESTAKSWSCSPEEAKLIWTACCCSRDVNGEGDNQYTAGLVLREEMKPSMLGTKKRVCIWNDTAKGILIVAVRGSKAPVDHMVNLAHTTDANHLTARELAGSHDGYLSCTEALIPGLQATFEKHVRDDEQIRHVLFTGESSGGAVASLLFFHFASQSSEIFGAAKLSLITFGCPPVTSQNLTTDAEGLSRGGLVLSLVNEGDFITRASEPYVRSILKLYRRHIDKGNVEAAGESGEWRLPGPSLYRYQYQIGRIVLLRPSLVLKDRSTPGCSEDGSKSECLELEYSDFARLLFCDFDVHKGSKYMERVEALKDKYDRPTS